LLNAEVRIQNAEVKTRILHSRSRFLIAEEDSEWQDPEIKQEASKMKIGEL